MADSLDNPFLDDRGPQEPIPSEFDPPDLEHFNSEDSQASEEHMSLERPTDFGAHDWGQGAMSK